MKTFFNANTKVADRISKRARARARPPRNHSYFYCAYPRFTLPAAMLAVSVHDFRPRFDRAARARARAPLVIKSARRRALSRLFSPFPITCIAPTQNRIRLHSNPLILVTRARARARARCLIRNVRSRNNVPRALNGNAATRCDLFRSNFRQLRHIVGHAFPRGEKRNEIRPSEIMVENMENMERKIASYVEPVRVIFRGSLPSFSLSSSRLCALSRSRRGYLRYRRVNELDHARTLSSLSK